MTSPKARCTDRRPSCPPVSTLRGIPHQLAEAYGCACTKHFDDCYLLAAWKACTDIARPHKTSRPVAPRFIV